MQKERLQITTESVLESEYLEKGYSSSLHLRYLIAIGGQQKGVFGSVWGF